MKTFLHIPVLLFTCLLWLSACQPARSHVEEVPTSPDPQPKQRIMLALLLDTSNSMDGLIDQAKSQLWRIVNELARAQCDDGSRPEIKIALYEYGNDGLSSYEGYIRQVVNLSTDLDLISEKLFSLTTNGGSEFCGQVIHQSLTELDWADNEMDVKMIFIAGNEPFTQGPIAFEKACLLAKEKGVVVNTIFCGDYQEGINTAWKAGADLALGTYMSIDSDRKTVFISTPYDDKIAQLNQQLNNTYVYYGKEGVSKKSKQIEQDRNAGAVSEAAAVDRAVSKSSYAYKNESWDLVDAVASDAEVLEEIVVEELPAELKDLDKEARKKYVEDKSKERAKIQKEIQALNSQRQAYIDAQKPEEEAASLDAALLKAIHSQGKQKQLKWEK
ncbi:hypothetical protein QWY31_06085 [Cytophagales bacterium LB-30]|uniref:VWA domain-containing protein n=1 Tax=Shiella aurantiaca TaxID=3058365 RepID=A0ABT8F3R1_9BACT|nr:hypothetical protein [Shiella aurantiaca]MDN4165062.1 hypothetical protein [Shiella aurantiaca]